MRTLARYAILLFLVAVVAAMAAYIGYNWQRSNQAKQSVSAVMERMRNIHEMALVESQMSLIYDYKDFWHFDVTPFRKKALILVEGDVKAGFDLEGIHIEWFLEERKVKIDSIPEVKILSVDHELKYYDLQEGSFNGFTAEELTELGKGAKKYLESKAIEAGTLREAAKRQKLFFEEVEQVLMQAGWEVDMALPLGWSELPK